MIYFLSDYKCIYLPQHHMPLEPDFKRGEHYSKRHSSLCVQGVGGTRCWQLEERTVDHRDRRAVCGPLWRDTESKVSRETAPLKMFEQRKNQSCYWVLSAQFGGDGHIGKVWREEQDGRVPGTHRRKHEAWWP
jgi:hypothetical protein